MIQLCKFLSLTITLVVVLNFYPIDGQNVNNYQKNLIKAKTIPTGELVALNRILQNAEYVPQMVEIRARRSAVIDSDQDLMPAAGHGYYQYARVPHKGAWEFGYKRGNPHHWREQHEQGHKNKFKTKLKWGDKKGGHGEHYWDYNHGDHHGHHGKGHHGGEGDD